MLSFQYSPEGDSWRCRVVDMTLVLLNPNFMAVLSKNWHTRGYAQLDHGVCDL